MKFSITVLFVAFASQAFAGTDINKLELQADQSTNLECVESILIDTTKNMVAIDKSVIRQTVFRRPLKIEQIDSLAEDSENLMSAYIVKGDGGSSYPAGLYERVEINFNRDSFGNEYYSATVKTEPLNYLNSAEVREGHGTCVYKKLE